MQKPNRILDIGAALLGAVICSTLAVTAVYWGCTNTSYVASISSQVVTFPGQVMRLLLTGVLVYDELPGTVITTAVSWLLLGAVIGVVLRRIVLSLRKGNAAQRWQTLLLTFFGSAAVVAAGILLTLVLGVLGLFGFFHERIPLSMISEETTLEFPPSAKLINSASGMDSWLAKVEIAPSDLPQLRKSLNGLKHVTGTENSTTYRFDTTNDAYKSVCGSRSRIPDWWSPSSARNYVALSKHMDYTGKLDILIVNDDPKRTILYLYAWGHDR